MVLLYFFIQFQQLLLDVIVSLHPEQSILGSGYEPGSRPRKRVARSFQEHHIEGRVDVRLVIYVCLAFLRRTFR